MGVEYIDYSNSKEVIITEDRYLAIIAEQDEHKNLSLEQHNKVSARIQALQDKAILEGLTESEKEEYKKLTSN